jgi:hypothetical protein
MLRERDCTPPFSPHDTLHVLHALNADTTQCSLHGCLLQACVSFKAPHVSPPMRGVTTMERLRV